MILIIDNYDSFTFNLAQAVGTLGHEVKVLRNDAVNLDEVSRMSLDAVIISPGPGVPEDAGISMKAVDFFKDKLPLLGVCLGHQALGAAFGCRVVRAERLMHGKKSIVYHKGDKIFKDIPSSFEAMRYHSLILERENLEDSFDIIAETKEKEIMGIRHRIYKNLVGVQFHPESYFTKEGMTILKNFLDSKPPKSEARCDL